MHIYGFGSICRGDVNPDSDIDLLAIVNGKDLRFNQNDFSIYSYKRIRAIWTEGNPFAWHLHLESKILFAEDTEDFLKSLGAPSDYKRALTDCSKFRDIFLKAISGLKNGTPSPVFEMSNMFLALRNFATCYSLEFTKTPQFSRYSALRLEDKSIKINDDVFKTLEQSRMLSTRGIGASVTSPQIRKVIHSAPEIEQWMSKLIKKCTNENKGISE